MVGMDRLVSVLWMQGNHVTKSTGTQKKGRNDGKADTVFILSHYTFLMIIKKIIDGKIRAQGKANTCNVFVMVTLTSETKCTNESWRNT